uniref:Uncharacterized protein n=1 Tax=Leersia perrieri TaxID=77586 RepID=A0A0D9XXV1_9ORYZ
MRGGWAAECHADLGVAYPMVGRTPFPHGRPLRRCSNTHPSEHQVEDAAMNKHLEEINRGSDPSRNQAEGRGD